MDELTKHVFGPVPSRRLGQSLGVSPIPPKTCNYSCVYCQIGRTTNYTNDRQDFFPKEEILEEIKMAITSNREIDYITFVGEGEPTLCKSLGWLIRSVKKLTDTPVAVITNGALLYDPEVRLALSTADVILPTLDAVDQRLFKKINRPIKGLDINQIIEGMRSFRAEFKGQIWMEIMLVNGLNDGPENIAQLKSVLDSLECDKFYVNVPIRPPAETWVKIPANERIIEICEILNAENIAYYESAEEFRIDLREKIEEQILKITTRHPLREDQILKMVGSPPETTRKLLEQMAEEGEIRKIVYNKRIFWVNAKSKIKHQS